MTDADKIAFGATLATFLGRRPDEHTVERYWRPLRDFTLAQVRAACDAVTESWTGQFPAVPARIRQAILERQLQQQNPDAQLWLMRSRGYRDADGTIHEAETFCEACGDTGWVPSPMPDGNGGQSRAVRVCGCRENNPIYRAHCSTTPVRATKYRED